MLSNGNRSNCGFEDVMVSYIYDEVATAERRKFESHLVDCSVCTDEFASISNARFSVFEWQKEEFANLSTPEIVIPYASGKTTEQESVGLLAGLRGLFSGFGLPVTVAAALVFCLGAGFIGMTLLGRGEQQIAANIPAEKPAVLAANTYERSPKVESVLPSAEITETMPAKELVPSSAEPKAVKAVENRRSRPNRQMTAAKDQRPRSAGKAPVLSNFDDHDDRSLRLADLFADEIGGGR